MIKKAFKKLFFGRKAYQSFFRKLFFVSLEGMNIGTGGRGLKETGEIFTVHYVLANCVEPVVFDIGAQGGHYLAEVISATNGKGRIYAFEPCLRDFEPLVKEFGKRATLINKALGDYDGVGKLYYPEKVRGVSSLYPGTQKLVKSEDVTVQTIDSFCLEQNIKQITFLKLDVEGNGLACLKGAKTMLPNIKSIQFEMSVSNRDSKTYFRDIFDTLHEYNVYRILKDGLFQINGPDKMNEILYTTNFLAVRK